MLVSILLIVVIAFGGLAATYLFADDEPLLWRVAAGNVIGSAVFGTLAFAGSSIAGFSSLTLIVCLVILLVLLIAFRDRERAKLLKHDWEQANAKLRNTGLPEIVRFAFYAFFLLLFVFFFRRAMIETPQGIFTGGSQNLGDLPFHLGAIFGFTDGNNFPPQNPSFAGAKFSYPFIADFLTSSFMRLGAGVSDAMFVQNVSWAFSLLVIFERFVLKLTRDVLAAKIAPAILLFSGGLGFFAFFTDFGAQGRGFFDFLWHLPADYTIGEKFRWGNSLVVMFLTQRSILLGMPLTILVLGVLWKTFSEESRQPFESKSFSIQNSHFAIFIAGLLAGLLPLIHLHSLAVLFVAGLFLFILQPDKWRSWLLFAAGVAVIAIPELLWSLTGTASETGKFIGWHLGWNKAANESFIWFWLANTGIFIPLAMFGTYLVWGKTREAGSVHKAGEADSSFAFFPGSLLLFSLPFFFLFLVSNVTKLAPWEWDNIKILIYWFTGSIPFAAIVLSWLWRRTTITKIVATACFAVLIFSGALDIWRTVSGQINYKVFDRDAITIAERIKQNTEPAALFLNAPTYNTAVVLSGRRSLMRYVGHLSSHGIDYGERENELKRIYQGNPDAAALIQKYGVQYVLISPEERNTLSVNEGFFMKYPLLSEAGQYRVYKVK